MMTLRRGWAEAKQVASSRSRAACQLRRPVGTRIISPYSRSSLRIHHTPKANRSRTVVSGRHQEILLVFIQAISLRKVPDGAHRLIARPASKNCRSSMRVAKFIGPLRHVADQIENSEETRTLWESRHVRKRMHHRTRIRRRKILRVHFLSPRIRPPIGRLRCILPLPFMRNALMRPCGVSAGILYRDPRYGLVIPTRRIVAVLPGSQKVVVVLRVIACCVQEFLKLGISHRRPIDIETLHMHSMAMEAASAGLPWILHVGPRIVTAFNFDSAHLKVIVAFGDVHHSLRSRPRRRG